ncbi:MAG: PAS domain-containing protein, partial [Rhodospirillum sp.]|nr:PAS domain-containing protein [Rhodospirillum sp.]
MTTAYLNLLGGLLAAGVVLAVLFTILSVFNRHRRQIDIQLREAELDVDKARMESAHFRSLIEGMADGLLSLDGEGRILSANPAASRILGRLPETLARSPLRALIPEFDPSWRYESGAAKRSKDGADLVVVAHLPNGVTMPVSLTVTPLAIENGEGMLVTLRDRREQTVGEEMDGISRAIDTHLLLGTHLEGVAAEICDRIAKLFDASVVS